MNTYVESVTKNNPAYKASSEATEGALLRSTEGTLLILPVLGVEANRGVDKSDTFLPQMNGDSRKKNDVSIFITEQTPFGLSAKLSYGQNHIMTDGPVSPSFVPYPHYYTAQPSISLSQSLWKNGFGSQVRAMKNLANASALASYYGQRAKKLGVLLEAQGAYYRLFYTQQTISAVKESLLVATKLMNWAKKRYDQGLGEKSDYLQTKAVYDSRQLELTMAEQELDSASRAFNSLRGEDSNHVAETLTQPELPLLQDMKFSDKKWRDDVRALQKQSEVARANAILGKEKNKPTLDVVGMYARNGLDTDLAKARDESTKSDYPSYSIGIRFSMPLAIGKSYHVRDGYEKEAYAADLDFKRKLQEQIRDFDDLNAKIKNGYTKLKLAKITEESQRLKIEEERRKHQRGRTTFFQVLQFEQDYLDAELNRIQIESSLSGLITQMQQYREE